MDKFIRACIHVINVSFNDLRLNMKIVEESMRIRTFNIF